MPEQLVKAVVVAGMVFCGVMGVVFLAYGRLWIQALSSGVHISIFSLVGMTLRKVRAEVIVENMIMAYKAGLKLPRNDLEAHYLARGNVPVLTWALVKAHQGGVEVSHRALGAHQLAGGDIEKVVTGLIAAKGAGLEDAFFHICAVDLAGEDVLQAVKRAAETGRLEDLKPEERQDPEEGAPRSG